MDKSLNEELEFLFEGLELPSDEQIKDDTRRLNLRQHFLGKKRPEGFGKRVGAKLKGRASDKKGIKRPKDVIEKIKNSKIDKLSPQKGIPKSDKMKEKLRQTMLLKQGVPKEKYTCPICNKVGGIGIMKRWGHGPNCTKG